MKYDPALDGLRAVAVSLVVIYHLSATAVPGGWVGVEIFFVLSGFLITGLLLDEIEATGRLDLPRFYLRRLVRLAPPFLLLLLALLCLLPFQRREIWSALGEMLAAVTYTMNWYRALSWGVDSELGHTWSLAMEEQFYLLWPPLLLMLPKRARVPVTALLIITITFWRYHLALTGASAYRVTDGFDTHAETLLMGCLIALVRRDGQPWVRTPAVFSLISVVGLIALSAAFRHGELATQTIGLTLAGFVGVALLLSARGEGFMRRVLSVSPLVQLGRISYGVYLWHYPVILLSERRHSSLILALAVPLTIGIAAVSFRYLELPLKHLKDRLPGLRKSEDPVGLVRKASAR